MCALAAASFSDSTRSQLGMDEIKLKYIEVVCFLFASGSGGLRVQIYLTGAIADSVNAVFLPRNPAIHVRILQFGSLTPA